MSINRQMGDAGYVGLGYRFSFDDGKSIQRYEDINADGTGTDVDSLFYDRRNSNLTNTFDMDYFYSDSVYRINMSASAAPVLMTIDKY